MFTDESEQVGLLFAAHPGVAVADAQRGLTAQDAFALLVRTSQHTNTRLLEVARYLTGSGELGEPR